MSKEQTRNKFKWRWSDLLHPFLLRQRYVDWKLYTTIADEFDNHALLPKFMQDLLKSFKEEEVVEKSISIGPFRLRMRAPQFTLLAPNKELKIAKDFVTHWYLRGENLTTLTLYFNNIETAKEWYDLEELKTASAFVFDDLNDLEKPKSTTYLIKFKAVSEDWKAVEYDIIEFSTRIFDPIG